jgi:hypothetical protein
MKSGRTPFGDGIQAFGHRLQRARRSRESLEPPESNALLEGRLSESAEASATLNYKLNFASYRWLALSPNAYRRVISRIRHRQARHAGL